MKQVILAALAAFAVVCISFGTLSSSSCATASKIPADVAGAVVDCTAAQYQSLEAEFGPLVKSLLESAWDGTSVNFSSLAGFTSTLAADGWCVVEQTVADIAKQSTTTKPKLGGKGPEFVASLTKGIADLRAKQFPGKSFKLRQ